MRTSTRHHLAGAVAALAVVAGAVGSASPAAADPAGLVVVGSTSASTSLDKTQSANCPAGTVVTGGGGYLTASPALHGYVALTRLEPLNNGAGFTATMREVVSNVGSWPLTAKAVCVPSPPGWDVVSATGVPEQSTVQVSCTSGRVAIGMGGRVNGSGVIIDHVKPVDNDTIEVRAVPVTGTNPGGWTVTAYATCAQQPAGYERIQFNADPAPGDQHVSVVDACPAGKALYGAGADIVAGNGSVALTNVNIAPSDTARARADVIAGKINNSWSLTVHGICGS